MPRQRVISRKDLIKALMDTELANHRHLSRVQARAVVNGVFTAITEALKNGEVVRLPVGAFAVTEQEIEPRRRWFLGRVRVTYKHRKKIEFWGDKHVLEPSEETGNDLEPNEQDSIRPKLSPSERRKLVIKGVKAHKTKRLIANELGVSERTIHRDLKSPRKRAKKKRRKSASAKSKAEQMKIAPEMPSEAKQQLKEEEPLTPEEVRQQRVQEMVELVHSWLAEPPQSHFRGDRIVDKARNRMKRSSNFYFDQIPESSKSAAELRDEKRPPEMDSAISQGGSRLEEVCSQWLAHWLAGWAPRDEALRDEVLNQVRAQQRVYPYFG